MDGRRLARAVAVLFLLNTWLSGYVAAAAEIRGGELAVARCLPDATGDTAPAAATHELCCTLVCAAGGALAPSAPGPALPAATEAAHEPLASTHLARAGADADHLARGPPAV
jgi:hypothetical protein